MTSVLGAVGIVFTLVVGALSAYSWVLNKNLDTLRAELQACTLTSTSYQTALNAARKAAEEQNAGIAALAEQTQAREAAVALALEQGKKRAAELERKLKEMRDAKQPDKDPCIAACMLLRSPVP